MTKAAILFDLPTYPKGVLSLSLVNVAACLSPSMQVEIIDLNFYDLSNFRLNNKWYEAAFFGLKVSSQNFQYALDFSARLKAQFPGIKIVWGGELPTLLPDTCLEYADTVVSGLFEPIAKQFIADLSSGNLQRSYKGENAFPLSANPAPRFDLVQQLDGYYSFMGLPLETSRGCTETCAFCMVHVMQKKNYFTKTHEQLQKELSAYKGRFINLVDYNFGVNPEHVIDVARLIQQSGARGWMAEMCIEMLDNDDVLKALQSSGCRMIYCGLESIDDVALRAVHKMNTNHIENYERIIRKVQSYGIQIAAGIILGIEDTHEKTFHNLYAFFNRMGILYAKLTFLTYNPGAKVQYYMKKKGEFVTEQIDKYDGNHLTYLPAGVKTEIVVEGTEEFIRKFYSLGGIIRRSFNTKVGLKRRLEFILFNIGYREVYKNWLKEDILRKDENFSRLLETPFKKSLTVQWSERALAWLG